MSSKIIYRVSKLISLALFVFGLKSGNNIITAILFIGAFKDVPEIWRGRVELSQYLVWSYVVGKQNVLQGDKGDLIGSVHILNAIFKIFMVITS